MFAGVDDGYEPGERNVQYNLKVFGQTRPPHTVAQMQQRDVLQKAVTDADYCRHNAEYNRRIRWCVDQGSQFWPAHDHKHCAPGDDANFVFGIPPWHPDGTPNPLGIPDNRCVEAVPSGFELPLDYCSTTGWACHKCQEWIPLPPRAYEGAVEPEDWWWCITCRKNKPKMTAREKKIQAVVAKVHDIREMMQ